MKFREVPLTALPDAGLIPGCGMLSSLRLSTQHILLFSQYRNTISLCHFTHVKAVSMSEYSISTYQLSGFLIERLEMGLNAWEDIINRRYMHFSMGRNGFGVAGFYFIFFGILFRISVGS